MYLETLPKPFLVLAPMDDVTDTVFRQIVAKLAPPDVFFTEFVNADGLQSPGRKNLLKKLRFTANEQPLVAQIWGKVPANFEKTAREIADGTLAREAGAPEGVNFAGIDLNMGCPVKNVVKNGTCSALIDNRELAVEIIKATQKGADGKLPVSVKTRLGSRSVDLSWHELLLRQNLSMLTIHGRTRVQMSAVPADWEMIGKVRELGDRIAPATYIVGNGDVRNYAHARQLAERYNLDGIMIGRGIFADPFAFATYSQWESFTKQQRLELYAQHVKLFAETWPGDERNIVVLNKFCKIYVNGFDGAKELREQLMRSQTAEDLLRAIEAATEN
ncbi:MAG TPA: tRNA-dihydrouridine synthase [Candidatus Saccharimonadales bacterium]